MISTFTAPPVVQQDLESVEKLMLAQAEEYHSDLKAALSVILSAGGKRVRPTIILLIGNLFHANKEFLIPLAASIELLHTATLIHDDLIDGSLLRRGIPTLNSKWSPAATVLTGDFVFASAANMANRTNSLEVMDLFSKTLMIIVNGEINQLFARRCSPNITDYYNRIYAKTASLFETSTYSAAIISNVDEDTKEALRKFGYEIGMAFQIVDDILDYQGDQSTIGKPVGGDLRQGLITLPMIYFLEDNPGDPIIKKHIHNGKLDDETEIQRLVESVSTSPSIVRAQQEARNFIERAEKCLAKLPNSPERDSLFEITRYISDREK